MTLKIWIVFFSSMTSCSLVRGYKFFRGTCYLQLQSRRQRQLQSRQWKQQFILRCWLSFTRLKYVITDEPTTKPTVIELVKKFLLIFTKHITLLLCSQWTTTGQHLEPDNSVHTLTNYFSKTQLNIILGLSSRPFHSGFTTIILYTVLISPTPIQNSKKSMKPNMSN